jgi:hypothetical protein
VSAILDPATVPLTVGSHDSPTQGVCVMELAAYLAGEPHSDHPACVAAPLAAFLRAWNDALDDTTRQRLRPYARRVLSTAGQPAADARVAWLATDWLVREQTPAWLDLAGLAVPAATLRALPALVDIATAQAVQPMLDAARAAAWAAVTTRFAPTVAALQESAFDLLDRMIAAYDRGSPT